MDKLETYTTAYRCLFWTAVQYLASNRGLSRMQLQRHNGLSPFSGLKVQIPGDQYNSILDPNVRVNILGLR